MEPYIKKDRLKKEISRLKTEGYTIALVPTMGALHQGHRSLVEEAFRNCDYVVVSIFVNPTQFDKKKDLDKYPRDIQADLQFLAEISPRILVFAPSAYEMYGDKLEAEQFNFDGLENEMEGRHRTGHFEGVGTVVKKLFEIVNPDYAYFGEKDYQQLAIIRKLVEILRLDVNIIGVPIYREKDGLAMSSRNVRLKPEYRSAAPFIYESLKAVKNKFGTESVESIRTWIERQFTNHPLLKLEYFEIADQEKLEPINQNDPMSNTKSYRAFVAVFADDIRLIDNIALN